MFRIVTGRFNSFYFSELWRRKALLSKYYFTTDFVWIGNYSHLALEHILPTSAAARVLLRTYEWLAGLSPTNTTLRWGRRFPAATHSSTSSRASLRICRASFLPEIITASCLENKTLRIGGQNFTANNYKSVSALANLDSNKYGKISLKNIVFLWNLSVHTVSSNNPDTYNWHWES